MKSNRLNDEPAPPKRAKWQAHLTWPLLLGGALTLAAVGILFASDPNQLFALKGGVSAGGGAIVDGVPYKLLGATALDPKDPALRFSETGMGQVLFTTANSDKCRRVLFDNKTGTSYWVRDVDCGRPAEQAVEDATPNRMLAVQKSFRR